MTITAPVGSDLVDPAWAQAITTALNSLPAQIAAVSARSQQPSCAVYTTSAQSIPNSAGTLISAFNTSPTTTRDTLPGLGFSAMATPSATIVMTVRVAGVYLVIGRIRWAVGTAGARGTTVLNNGAGSYYLGGVAGVDDPWEYLSGAQTTGSDHRSVSAGLLYCPVGTTLSMFGIQTSGGALNTQYCEMQAIQLAN